MQAVNWRSLARLGLVLVAPVTLAERYTDTIALSRHAGPAAEFFKTSHGYAVFPMIGKGGLMYQAAVAGQKFSFTPAR